MFYIRTLIIVILLWLNFYINLQNWFNVYNFNLEFFVHFSFLKKYIDWLTDWLIDWVTDWLIDWLIDWLGNYWKHLGNGLITFILITFSKSNLVNFIVQIEIRVFKLNNVGYMILMQFSDRPFRYDSETLGGFLAWRRAFEFNSRPKQKRVIWTYNNCCLKGFWISRSSHRKCSLKKCFLRNFAKFTDKHLCQSLFFNKVAGLRQNTSGRLLLNISNILIIFCWLYRSS